MSKSSNTPETATVIRPQDYADSPVHYAVATSDHATLTKLIASLPTLSAPTQIQTESESIAQDGFAAQISEAIDRRDNPLNETPLHLAVRLNDVASARLLAVAGADISLHNASGWNPLQEALLRRNATIISVLLQHHHLAAWNKWRRRLPRLVAALRRVRDFYMEISFHFESSIVPFIGKIAPSDTYKIWKRDGNLRADTTLSGYDGLKIQRANQSFLFLNDAENRSAPDGVFLIVNHDKREIHDAFENAGSPLTESDVTNFCNQTSVYRPGMDVTKSKLIGRTNWRGQEKTESVGDWKSRVYDLSDVVFTFRSRKLNAAENRDDVFSPNCILPLEIDEESDDGFIVAENPRFSVSADDQRRRHSNFAKEDTDFVTVSRKSVDIIPSCGWRRRAPPLPPPRPVDRLVAPPPTKDKEQTKNLRPTVWLTEQFPLKTEEFLPLLDILASKIKAVRRMREVLTTTFPPGTFPVKVSIPVVPTVRVVITFTKFTELQSGDKFYTPMSSPRQFPNVKDSEVETTTTTTTTGDGNFSWWRGGNSRLQPSSSGTGVEKGDPFEIPSTYSWSSLDDKNSRKMRKSKPNTKTG